MLRILITHPKPKHHDHRLALTEKLNDFSLVRQLLFQNHISIFASEKQR